MGIFHEDILTRLTAAIFFLSPTEESKLEKIWNELTTNEILQYKLNQDKTLSQLDWKVEFTRDLNCKTEAGMNTKGLYTIG